MHTVFMMFILLIKHLVQYNTRTYSCDKNVNIYIGLAWIPIRLFPSLFSGNLETDIPTLLFYPPNRSKTQTNASKQYAPTAAAPITMISWADDKTHQNTANLICTID